MENYWRLGFPFTEPLASVNHAVLSHHRESVPLFLGVQQVRLLKALGSTTRRAESGKNIVYIIWVDVITKFLIQKLATFPTTIVTRCQIWVSFSPRRDMMLQKVWASLCNTWSVFTFEIYDLKELKGRNWQKITKYPAEFIYFPQYYTIFYGPS